MGIKWKRYDVGVAIKFIQDLPLLPQRSLMPSMHYYKLQSIQPMLCTIFNKVINNYCYCNTNNAHMSSTPVHRTIIVYVAIDKIIINTMILWSLIT